MSYPSGPPGNPGYQSGPQAPQYGAPPPQYAVPQEPVPAGPSKLPLYLAGAIAILGLAVYLSGFGPMFTLDLPSVPGLSTLGDSVSATPVGVTLAMALAVLAGLLAGVGLLPKQTKAHAVTAVLSVLAVLLVLSQLVGQPSQVKFGWGLYLLIALTVLQAVAAVAALLLDAEVITAPVPKPRYEQQPYGQYGAPGGYYGQQPDYGQPQPDYGQQQHGGPQRQVLPQRPGYTQSTHFQQGPGYPGATSMGGFGGQEAPPTEMHSATPGSAQNSSQNGPPTPPTGFPAFGQPQQQGGSPEPSSETTVLTQSFDTQQPQQQAAPPSSPPPS